MTTTTWSGQDALDMMRYGKVWRIVKLKAISSDEKTTSYRCMIRRVRRRGKLFYNAGKLQNVLWTTSVKLGEDDLIFRDNAGSGFTRLQLLGDSTCATDSTHS